MTALARWCLRHRRIVISFWIAAFLVGAMTAGTTTDRMSTDFALPGQDGYDTAKRVLETYDIDTQRTPVILVLSGEDGTRVDPAEASKIFSEVERNVPGVIIIEAADTRNIGTGSVGTGNPDARSPDAAFSTADGRDRYAYAFYPRLEGFDFTVSKDLDKALTTAAAAEPSGLTARVTGTEVLATNSGASEGPGVLAETLLGGLGALAVLAFVFASLLALVPLLVAGVAILSTFLILLALTTFADVSFLVQFLVSLIGLGVAIDYSLLLVTRWREERAHGRGNHDAVIASAATAGRAVAFSGLTVAIGLVALVIIPVPFLRSVGYAGMLIPLVSVAVTMTLLPALLGGIGPRVDWPRIRREGSASRFWSRWAAMVVRRRWIAAAVGIGILVALFIPFLGMRVGTAQSESLSKSGPAYEAVRTLEDGGMPTGALTPIEVLTEAPAADEAARAAAGVEGVTDAFAVTDPRTAREGLALVLAIPAEETAGGDSVDPVRDVKSAVGGIPGVVGVTGVGALQLDYLHGVYGNFPYALAAIVAITYILLARAFRSLLLPLKAVLFNLFSLGAAFGGLVLFWQEGYGSEAIYDIEPTGAITFWLPLMVFAFLIGLSMDYEVFILSRVREEYDAGADTDQAVIEGVGRTGRLVTSAALILFLAFMSLSTGPQTDVKVFATGLGFGILLDATVVRMLLVPALVSLFGRWNWYLPGWAARVLRVAPSRPLPQVRTAIPAQAAAGPAPPSEPAARR
jgi:RND superfamily putative drug exporter